LDVPLETIPAIDADVGTFLGLQAANGSWPDIDYNDPDGRSWWKAGEHLRRSILVATAYQSSKSKFYNKPDASTSASAAVLFWNKVQPAQSNWWWF